MKKVRSRASSGSSVALREVDKLIRELRKACHQAERRGDPGCAELMEVLARAEAIPKLLEATQSPNWGRIIGIATFLLELTKAICSSLNCIFTREQYNGNWINHKASTQIRVLVSI